MCGHEDPCEQPSREGHVPFLSLSQGDITAVPIHRGIGPAHTPRQLLMFRLSCPCSSLWKGEKMKLLKGSSSLVGRCYVPYTLAARASGCSFLQSAVCFFC